MPVAELPLQVVPCPWRATDRLRGRAVSRSGLASPEVVAPPGWKSGLRRIARPSPVPARVRRPVEGPALPGLSTVSSVRRNRVRRTTGPGQRPFEDGERPPGAPTVGGVERVVSGFGGPSPRSRQGVAPRTSSASRTRGILKRSHLVPAVKGVTAIGSSEVRVCCAGLDSGGPGRTRTEEYR
jgi:hypothetical protein